MTDTGEVIIRAIDPRAISEEDIVAGNEFGNKMEAESHPEDPPTSLEMARVSVRNIPDFVEIKIFRAVDRGGMVVGSANASWALTDENQHLANASVRVLPEFRRRGIATMLLRSVVDAVEGSGRRLILSTTSERVPAGEAFAQRVGAERAFAGHLNRLDLAKVDRGLVRRWIEEGPGRAPGYSLVPIDGPYPDDLVDDIIEVHHVMNDAPRDDLDMEDSKLTVEQMREIEKSMLAAKTERWAIFARHDESGRLVGLTDVAWNPEQRETVWQGNTGVSREHRGHALGKWLKAVMLQRILDERPYAKDVRTGNADSNDAMLGINKQLGFEHYIADTGWQVSVEKLRAYVDDKI